MATKKGLTKKKIITPLFCCCFWIRDPRSGIGKNQDPRSRINIPDPQHCVIIKLTYRKGSDFRHVQKFEGGGGGLPKFILIREGEY